MGGEAERNKSDPLGNRCNHSTVQVRSMENTNGNTAGGGGGRVGPGD